jgi:RNA polymerase sigma factor (sigma-70 family)
MATLSERQRSVLLAKVFDGMTFAEIGREMGLSTPTVKTHYLRALRAMRDGLQQKGVRSREERSDGLS